MLVIGPTYQSLSIKTKDYLIAGEKYQATIKNQLVDGCSSIVLSLLTLDIETFFLTRLSYDNSGNAIMQKIKQQNGFVYSNGPIINSTATKVYVNDVERNITSFSSLIYDNYPQLKDGLPYEFFDRQQYGIMDVVNYQYLEEALNRNRNIKWFAYNFIPDDRFLTRFEGIFLTKEKADSIANAAFFASLSNKLFSAGLKWIVVFDGPTLCEVFTPKEIKSFVKERSGNYPIGCFETFIAMTTACYINNYDFYTCIDRGLNIANELSYIQEVYLKKEMF